MKKSNFLIISLLFIFTISLASCCHKASSPTTKKDNAVQDNKAGMIQWLEWAPALSHKAAAEKKLILIYRRDALCSDCEELDKNLFSNPAILKLLETSFYPVKTTSGLFPHLGNARMLFIAEDKIIGTADTSDPEKFRSLAEKSLELFKTKPDVSEVLFLNHSPAKEALSWEKLFPKTLPETADSLVSGNQGNLPGKIEYLLMAYRINRNDKILNAVKKGIELLEKNSDNELGGFFGEAFSGKSGGRASAGVYVKSLSYNADAIRALIHASLATGEGSYRRSAEKALEYALKNLSSQGGLFYTGQGEHPSDSAMSPKEYFALPVKDRVKKGFPVVEAETYAGENARFAGALLEAAEVLDKKDWRDTAIKTIENLLAASWEPEKGVSHREAKNGGAGSAGLLEDNALLLTAVLDAYESSGETRFLETAEKIEARISGLFLEKNNGAFRYATKDYTAPAPPKQDYFPLDSNILMARNLDRLGFLSHKNAYNKKAEAALKNFQTAPDGKPETSPAYSTAVYLNMNHPIQCTIIGKKSDLTTTALRLAARMLYEPNKTVATIDPKKDISMMAGVQYQARPLPTLYACCGTACAMPIQDPRKIDRFLSMFISQYMYKGLGGPDSNFLIQ